MPAILGKQRGMQGGVKQTNDGFAEYETTWVYKVQADSKDQTEQTILSTQGLPITGFSAIGVGPFGTAAICVSKNAVQDKINATIWDVTCVFSTAAQRTQNQQSEAEQNADPTQWVPQVKYFSEEIETVLFKDFNDDPITNPVGELFADPITTPIMITGMRFVQYETGIDFATIVARSNKANSATFQTAEPHYLLCKIEDADYVFRNGILCWAVQYAIRYHPQTWKEPRLRVGSGYFATANTPLTFKLFEDTSAAPKGYGLLNSDGTQKSGMPSSTDFDEFQRFDTIDFSTFLRI